MHEPLIIRRRRVGIGTEKASQLRVIPARAEIIQFRFRIPDAPGKPLRHIKAGYGQAVWIILMPGNYLPIGAGNKQRISPLILVEEAQSSTGNLSDAAQRRP